MFWKRRKEQRVTVTAVAERLVPIPTWTEQREVTLSTRSDGSVLTGYRLPFAEKLYAAETPPMWGLAKQPAHSPAVAAVRIGDRLTVKRVEARWLVFAGDETLGACRWRAADHGRADRQGRYVIRYPDVGELEVTQVLRLEGVVIDFGGVVRAT